MQNSAPFFAARSLEHPEIMAAAAGLPGLLTSFYLNYIVD